MSTLIELVINLACCFAGYLGTLALLHHGVERRTEVEHPHAPSARHPVGAEGDPAPTGSTPDLPDHQP